MLESPRGDGKQVRDVLLIDDLLDLYDTVRENTSMAAGKVYNIGTGPDNTDSIWTEFGPILEKLLWRPVSVSYSNWRPGDQHT